MTKTAVTSHAHATSDCHGAARVLPETSRKAWKSPKVITSAMSEAANNLDAFEDGAAFTNSVPS